MSFFLHEFNKLLMGASLPDFMLTYRAVEIGVFFICFGLVLNLFIYLGRNCRVCRILAPQPGIEPMLPTVEARSPNHWTTREVPPHETGSPAWPGVETSWKFNQRGSDFTCLVLLYSEALPQPPGICGS